MTQKLNQPEEIERALKELVLDDMTDRRQMTDDALICQVIQKSWNTGYLPPYRAAYIKDHKLEL